jgi:hypothetical protein
LHWRNNQFEKYQRDLKQFLTLELNHKANTSTSISFLLQPLGLSQLPEITIRMATLTETRDSPTPNFNVGINVNQSKAQFQCCFSSFSINHAHPDIP